MSNMHDKRFSYHEQSANYKVFIDYFNDYLEN